LPVILLVREGAGGSNFRQKRFSYANSVDASALAALTRAVVVTENHRVGAFGFFTPEAAFTPNLGLLDLAAALIFVREVSRMLSEGGFPI